MAEHSRRSFLKISGTALGGIAAGSSVVAAASSERFLVDTRNTPRSEVEASGLEVVHDLSEINVLVVSGAESDVDSLGVDYAADSVFSLDLPVDDDAPVTVEDAGETSDEPYYPLQWDKEAQNVPEAHDISRGEDTRVTVIDTGVAAGHPDLAHAVNEDLSRNFTGDDYGAAGPYGGYHGSHVAGIIAANDQNDEGVVGTAPATEVVDCRVFSPNELASFADILAAIVYSVRIDADAANMSIGAYPIPRQGLGQFYGKALNRVTTYANRNGTLLVASAGNAGADLQHDGDVISLPNEAANTMSISATGPIGFGWGDDGLEDGFDSPAFYTNYGTNAINVGAPGGDADLGAIGSGAAWYYDLVLNAIADPIYDEDGNYQGADYSYGWVAGTSMAAPQVVGAAALVKSQNPGYNANQVREALQTSADTVEEYGKEYYGSGFLNPHAALK
jgi:subtilisin family serine protease